MGLIEGIVYINGGRSKEVPFKAKVTNQQDIELAKHIFKKDGYDTLFRIKYKKGERRLYC